MENHLAENIIETNKLERNIKLNKLIYKHVSMKK